MIKDYEIRLIDNYVISNNITTMDIVMFRNIVDMALPLWRSEQLCGNMIADDNGEVAYNQYINFRA